MKLITPLLAVLFVSSYVFAQTAPAKVSMDDLIKKLDGGTVEERESATNELIELWDKWSDDDIKKLEEAKGSDVSEVSSRAIKAFVEISERKLEVRWVGAIRKFEQEMLRKMGKNNTVDLVYIKSNAEKILGSKIRFFSVVTNNANNQQAGSIMYALKMDGTVEELNNIADLADVVRESNVKVSSEKEVKTIVKFFTRLFMGMESNTYLRQNYGNYLMYFQDNNLTIEKGENNWKAKIYYQNYATALIWEFRNDKDSNVKKIKAAFKMNYNPNAVPAEPIEE